MQGQLQLYAAAARVGIETVPGNSLDGVDAVKDFHRALLCQGAQEMLIVCLLWGIRPGDEDGQIQLALQMFSEDRTEQEMGLFMDHSCHQRGRFVNLRQD
jgi:hypothetical protein